MAKTGKSTRALIVVRLSRLTDESTSPEHQRAACEQYCASRGWDVVGVAEDLDVSAGNTSPFELARAEVPALIEKMTPAFDAAVEVYVEAVAKLPDNLTAESLVAARPATLAAYNTAVGAAEVLSRINRWVASAGNLSGGGGRSDFSVQILAPRSRRELDELDRTKTNTRHDPMVHQIVPVFMSAARLGVPFEIHTPSEAHGLRAAIESQPVEDAPRIRGQW